VNRVFFTDRDLGTRFPEILAAAGLLVQRHRDNFPPDCPDEEWLRAVGEKGWVAITHESRIRYKPNELAAVIRHNVSLLVVIGKAPFPVLASNFVATEPKIAEVLRQQAPPMIAKVYRPSPAELDPDPMTPGSVAVWYPPRK